MLPPALAARAIAGNSHPSVAQHPTLGVDNATYCGASLLRVTGTAMPWLAYDARSSTSPSGMRLEPHSEGKWAQAYAIETSGLPINSAAIKGMNRAPKGQR